MATAESPVAITEKWRAKHESDYRREWVSIAGLHKLNPGSNTAGSAASNDIVLPPAVPLSSERSCVSTTAFVSSPPPAPASA